MKYIIAEQYNITELQKSVNVFIEHGYKPQGGVAVSTQAHTVYYTQALSKLD